jgi:hypothetical protein
VLKENKIEAALERFKRAQQIIGSKPGKFLKDLSLKNKLKSCKFYQYSK